MRLKADPFHSSNPPREAIMKKLLTAALLSAVLAPCAFAQAVSEKDGRLTDASGRTLYTFDKDSATASACNGGCAAMWPPFVAPGGAAAKGDFTLVGRDDGAQQWSYKGRPLYLFSGDTKPGEAKGEGMGGVWHSVSMGAPKPSAPSGYDTIRGNY
jgi:predicted lipoprotein with Yx(FWY)xxD motif